MFRFGVYSLIFAGLFVAYGCESKKPVVPSTNRVTSEDVRRDVDKVLDTASEYSQQKKEEFQKDLEAKLAKLEIEVAKLREKGVELKDDVKVNWDQKMAGLETKQKSVRAKLAEVENATAEAWQDVQKGAQSAWEDLDKAIRDAAKEF